MHQVNIDVNVLFRAATSPTGFHPFEVDFINIYI